MHDFSLESQSSMMFNAFHFSMIFAANQVNDSSQTSTLPFWQVLSLKAEKCVKTSLKFTRLANADVPGALCVQQSRRNRPRSVCACGYQSDIRARKGS